MPNKPTRSLPEEDDDRCWRLTVVTGGSVDTEPVRFAPAASPILSATITPASFADIFGGCYAYRVNIDVSSTPRSRVR
jgi:hypothetical protein